MKHCVEKRFFIEKILYLFQTTKILHACKGIPHAIKSCSDYPFISSIDFPVHILFPAFMLHDKALKVIPINESFHRPLRWICQSHPFSLHITSVEYNYNV